MEENLILDKLVQFGLTRQEANIYLCLYQNGELTGYEVAEDDRNFQIQCLRRFV